MTGHGRRRRCSRSRKSVPALPRRRDAFRAVAVVLAATVVGGATALYVGETRGRLTDGSISSAQSTASAAPPEGPPPSEPSHNSSSPTPAEVTALNFSFEALAQAARAKIGMVLTPVGSQEAALLLGDWSIIGPAWSTIKVPLAIAAMRHQSADPDLLTAAITESDNAAAEQLWSNLGDPTTASSRVQEILSSVGDPTTVQSQRIRPEFSAFGQTQWPLTAQAKFLSLAVCDARNQFIFDLMQQITTTQSWGLGNVPNAAFKGGWGPSPSGHYLVRQMGIVDSPTGQVAVALAAQPNSGNFADGTAAITAVAGWLTQHSSELPSGRCR